MVRVAVMLLILALTLASGVMLTAHARGRSQGLMRSHAVLAGAVACGILAVPNPWLQGLLALMLVNLVRDPDPTIHLGRALPLYLLMMAGVLILQGLGDANDAFIWWALVWLAGIGVFFGLWSLISWWHIPHGWRWTLGPFSIWEDDGWMIRCGQENANNLQAIAVVAWTATLALAWGDSPWWLTMTWLPLIPVLGVERFTSVLDQQAYQRRFLSMGPVLVAGVLCAVLPLLIGWWTLMFIPVPLAALAWAFIQGLIREHWWDSGRIRAWWILLLTGWWHGGWRILLWGRGWQSWVAYYDFVRAVAAKAERKPIMQTEHILSTAHNEYVQLLFEHGVLALLCLLGYLISTLWRLGHGSPIEQAVYLMGVAMCGVAFVLHPWTWYHHTVMETPQPTNKKEPVKVVLYAIGSPALVWISFLLVLMAEISR